jgi:hypothetical protein
MKLMVGVLLAFFFLVSCSKDDANSIEDKDIIIGKWKVVEKYEFNELVDLPICLPHIFTEYKLDHTVSGGKIISNNFPAECNMILFDSGVVWDNLGHNNYRIGNINDHGNIYVIYKDGMNLVEEHPDGVTKLIYTPYQ